MARFRDTKTLQKFTAVHASIHNHFNLWGANSYISHFWALNRNSHPAGYFFRSIDPTEI